MITQTISWVWSHRRWFFWILWCFFSRIPLGGGSSRTTQHVRASEKKSIGPKMALFRPFSRGKKVPKKKKKSWKKTFFLVVLVITRALCQIVAGLSEGLLIISYHPFPTFLPSAAPKPPCAKYLHSQKKSRKKISKKSQNIPKIFPLLSL